jgi:hypothetical protein
VDAEILSGARHSAPGEQRSLRLVRSQACTFATIVWSPVDYRFSAETLVNEQHDENQRYQCGDDGFANGVQQPTKI